LFSKFDVTFSITSCPLYDQRGKRRKGSRGNESVSPQFELKDLGTVVPLILADPEFYL
jgi:hypothetical protein